jgi:hypothetical protein
VVISTLTADLLQLVLKRGNIDGKTNCARRFLHSRCFSNSCRASQKHSYVPPKGFVPDEKTAIRIAEAVWSPIYGEAMIQGEKPFVASLKSGVWTVGGRSRKVGSEE